MPNEQEQFLKDLESDDKKVDILEQPLIPEKEKEEVVKENKETEAEAEQKLKNRRERRLAEKWQAERESNIALNARLETIAEAQKAQGADSSEYLKAVEKIYGSETPEAVAATELLKTALKGVEERAYSRAIETSREEQSKLATEERRESERLDSFIENIEDEFSVTVSEAQEKDFFTFLERLSPKDKSGDIVEYADPLTVWELYQERISQKPASRAKALASRSITQGGVSGDTKLQTDSTERFLKEQGII